MVIVIFLSILILKEELCIKIKENDQIFGFFVIQMVVYGQKYHMTKFKANLLVNLLTI